MVLTDADDVFAFCSGEGSSGFYEMPDDDEDTDAAHGELLDRSEPQGRMVANGFATLGQLYT
jgi:hypothetical protein